MFSCAAMLAGCVTDEAAAPPPIQQGQAVVTISRTDGMLAALVSARVDVNSVRFASLERGATFTGGVSPGPVALTASAFGSVGQFTVHFKAEAGKRYAFEVSPRGEVVVAGMAAGLVGVIADTAVNGGEQSGTFKIVQLPNAR